MHQKLNFGPFFGILKEINSLTSMSDQDRISPYNINTTSSRQVMRIKKNINLGPVVQRLISANPRLNFNLDFFIHLFKCLFGIVSRVLYRASNNHILDKKNSTEFSFKAIRSEIRIHTNPGLS